MKVTKSFTKKLLDAYNNSLPFEEEAVTGTRLILEKILKNSKKNYLYKPTYGKQFFYKESQSKGEIIIRYIKKLQQLQEKIDKIESQIKYQVRKI